MEGPSSELHETIAKYMKDNLPMIIEVAAAEPECPEDKFLMQLFVLQEFDKTLKQSINPFLSFDDPDKEEDKISTQIIQFFQ